MPTPVIEQIALELVRRLETITEANGYTWEVPFVERAARLPGQTIVDRAILLDQEEPEEVEAESHGSDEWLQPFAIQVYILPSDDDATPIDTYINTVVADVMRAVVTAAASGQEWESFGANLAINATWMPPEYMAGDEGAFVGVAVRLGIHYRTAMDDPYTNA